MVVKLGTTCCLHLSPPPGVYSPLFTPLSPGRRCRPGSPLVCLADRTAFLGSGAAKLFRSRSVGDAQLIRRTSSWASSSSCSDGGFWQDDESEDEDEFAERLQELAARMETERSTSGWRALEVHEEEGDVDVSGEMIAAAFSLSSPRTTADDPAASPARLRAPDSVVDVAPPKWAAVPRALPSWRPTVGGGMDSNLSEASVHRQRQPYGWDDGAAAAAAASSPPAEGEAAACCSVRRAFSSTVFIIRELQSHALRLREVVSRGREELHVERVVARVQAEVHASFCWLFQQIFSCTPTLMVSVMLLLANFTVHSMAAGGIGAAAAAPGGLRAPVVAMECSGFDVQEAEQTGQLLQQQQDKEAAIRSSGGARVPSSAPAFSLEKPPGGALTAGAGGDGGSRSSRPVAGATDDSNNHHGANGGDHHSSSSSSRHLTEEEARAWRRIQDEATKLQSATRPESLTDPDTLRHLVAPVSLPDLASTASSPDTPAAEYMRTELEYRMAVEATPDNPLLLANYAQFLFLVARDHDRAEHYFKRAAAVHPRDGESLARYADFLWLARNDVCAAEEAYLEALEADPGNACYAASYAHFLWNTGGEDTCFPLGDQDYCHQDGDEDDAGLEDTTGAGGADA